jgi:V/A-type H+-transporting ATPase subunit I
MAIPELMSKLTIVGHKSKLKKVIKELYELKAVHIEQHLKNESINIGKPFEESNKLSEILVKLRSIASFLNIDISKKPEISEFKRLVTKYNIENYYRIEKATKSFYDEVVDKFDTLKSIDDQLNKNKEKIIEINILKVLGLEPEDLRDYNSIFYVIGYIKNLDFKKELRELTGKYKLCHGIYNKKDIIALFADIKFKDRIIEILNKSGFNPVELVINEDKKDLNSIMQIVKKEQEKLLTKKERIKMDLDMISRKWGNFLRVSEIIVGEELEKAQVPLKFGESNNLFLVNGWVPKKNINKLRKRLDDVSNNKIYIKETEVKEDDKIPIKLNNKRIVKPFEFFMDLYTLPSYKEVDPSFLVFLTFPLFFGFMLGDMGYGLTTLLLFLLLKRKIKTRLLDVMIFASLSTIFFGALFGEFFGEEVLFGFELPHLISRAHQITELLLISILIGIVHVNIGLFTGFYNELRQHGLKVALYEKYSWVLLQIAVFIIYIGFTKSVPNLKIIGILFFLLSVIMLYKGEGVKGLIELPGIFSNILSYARLMALGLASVALAAVVNQFAFDFFHKGGFMIIAGILILLFGHVINIGLGILGPFLHSLRLHYVEFFSKFFKGGGKPYVPFGIKSYFMKQP